MTTPLVKMLCHEGPVRSIACDKLGQYMATSGNDGHVKVWDLRYGACILPPVFPLPTLQW
jgi:U3 small nucleolar RNA-associated protein 7